MSSFAFINDEVLRGNLDITFEHIIRLIAHRKIATHQEAITSYGKTIIVFTASIIEALLIHMVKSQPNDEIVLKNDWTYRNVTVLHSVNTTYQIIGGKRLLMRRSLGNLNLNQLIDYCKQTKLINADLAHELHRVRSMRNKVHIGNLTDIDRGNTDKDLEYAFSVTTKVKALMNIKT